MSDPNITFSYFTFPPTGQVGDVEVFEIACLATRRDDGAKLWSSYFVGAALTREETFPAALLFICAELETRLRHALRRAA